MSQPPPRRPEVAAGAIVWRGDDVLLIRRGQPPRQGQWSIPGGRVEWGETVREAVAREVLEETGCTVSVGDLCDVVDALFEDRHLVLVDFTARWVSGEPRPGDDASDARFVPFAALEPYALWDETARVIALSRTKERIAR